MTELYLLGKLFLEDKNVNLKEFEFKFKPLFRFLNTERLKKKCVKNVFWTLDLHFEGDTVFPCFTAVYV